MGKDLVSKKDNSEMINLDDVTKENIKERNPKWPQIPDHPYRILQMWGWGSGKNHYSIWKFSNLTLIRFIYMLKIHMKHTINCL